MDKLGEDAEDFNTAFRLLNGRSPIRLISWLWTSGLSHLPQVL